MKRPATSPPLPPPIRKESDSFFANDPITGESFYYLRPIEKVSLWILIAVLYIAHAAIIGTLAILIYEHKTTNMETTQKTVYISGPITNIPHGNVTTFAAVTQAVRNLGHIARNPHEFCHDIPKDAPWETFMRRGIQQLMDCTDIVMLPEWESSDGAVLEQMTAQYVGINFHNSFDEFRTASINEEINEIVNG